MVYGRPTYIYWSLSNFSRSHLDLSPPRELLAVDSTCSGEVSVVPKGLKNKLKTNKKKPGCAERIHTGVYLAVEGVAIVGDRRRATLGECETGGDCGGLRSSYLSETRACSLGDCCYEVMWHRWSLQSQIGRVDSWYKGREYRNLPWESMWLDYHIE